MAQETTIILNKDDRWIETILNNGAHFVVSFPPEDTNEEEKTIKVFVRRRCKHYQITKTDTLTLSGKKYAAMDFPFLEGLQEYVDDEPAVDVYVEVGASLIKKITFTYE